MSYSSERRNFSDQFIPHMKQIIGPHLIEPASFKLDTEQATDLVIFRARDLRIAARVRTPQYRKRYPYQFTIRSVSHGNKTEMHKIKEGWGDLMFYGFASDDLTDVPLWYLINLDNFRADLWFLESSLKKGHQPNGDGTEFDWFDVRTLSPDVIRASSPPVPFVGKTRAA